MIRTTVGEQRPQQARLRVRDGRGLSLRRRATAATDAGDGWWELEVELTDAEAFADEVTGYGPDVVVIEPAEVREAVVRRLTGAARAHLSAGAAQTSALVGEEA
jgi:proteasome accessory factor B